MEHEPLPAVCFNRTKIGVAAKTPEAFALLATIAESVAFTQVMLAWAIGLVGLFGSSMLVSTVKVAVPVTFTCTTD